MLYYKWAGICAFISIIFFTISVIIRNEKKRKIIEGFIYRKYSKKSNDNDILETLVRLLGPLILDKAKLREIKYYLDNLEYKISPEKIYICSIGGGLLLGLIYFLVLSAISIYIAIPAILLGILAGYHLPLIYLKSKFESIQREKQLGILPYIEMLQVACEAGLTLTLAIERVYEYYPTPLSLEFKKANTDFMTNIKTRDESLRSIIDRVGGDEIRFLVDSILQSLNTGTPMKETLKSLADAIRRDLRKKIITKGQKAKWKNFIVSIGFQLPPYIFIIAGPALVGLMGSL